MATRCPGSAVAAAGGDAGRGGLLVADRRQREGARAAQERPVTNVGAWLQGLGLDQYEAAFHDNGVDASVLPELTAEDLKEPLPRIVKG